MKSTLFNMVAVLFTITLIASAGVGAVNMITEDAIAEANRQATVAAVANVLPAFEKSEMSTMTIDEMPINIYTAVDGSGAVVGYAVETMTMSGFSGKVRMMVGFDAEGTILNVNVLEQSETPGLGSKMCDEGNVLLASVQGKNPANLKLKVKKDGGDIDALTAATISSRAYADAVARAYEAFKVASGGWESTDGVSGATATHEGHDAQEGGDNE